MLRQLWKSPPPPGGGGGGDSTHCYPSWKELCQNYHNGIGVLSSSTYMTDLWADKPPPPPPKKSSKIIGWAAAPSPYNIRQVYFLIAEIWNFHHFCQKIHGKLWGDDINSLICISFCSRHQMFTALFELVYSFKPKPDVSSKIKK